MNLSPERRDRQARDNAAATERKRLAVLAMDAAGLCRRCGKAERDDGLTSCTPCRDRINVARSGRTVVSRLPVARFDDFCVECIASGFHRDDCHAQARAQATAQALGRVFGLDVQVSP